MRAAIIRSYGGPEAFELIDIDKPRPLPTEVLIRVKAVGVNPVEMYIRSGAFPLHAPPVILGWDVSGVVEEVVPGVSRFRVGDEVFGMPFFPRPAQTYAEYVVAPSRQLAQKPKNVSHAEAAALPLVGLTAYQALVDIAHVQKGQRVLVHAGGGGVGHVAIQIAKILGAHVSTTVSTEKATFARELGADQVIDYRVQDFSEQLRDIDVVLDVVGGGYAQRSIPVLRKGGILVTAVERMNQELPGLVEREGRRFASIAVEPDGVGMEQLARWAAEGKLRAHVSKSYPLAQVADAHRELEKRSTVGKVVLNV